MTKTTEEVNVAHKDVKAPPELVAAADVALNANMRPKRATDLLRLLMIRGAIERHGGKRAEAAKSLGMSSSAMNVAITVLESRF